MMILPRCLVFVFALLLASSPPTIATADAPLSVEFPKLRSEAGASPIKRPPASFPTFARERSKFGAASAVLIDVASGEIIESFNPAKSMPPASVAKVITTLYAIDRLGAEYQFVTNVEINGPVEGGIVQGDLILRGGGDPALDSDEMALLLDEVVAFGIKGITGAFIIDTSALPELREIHNDQPPQAAYNPGISALNTNFNRVHLEWVSDDDGTVFTLKGRAERYMPVSNRVSIEKVAGLSRPFEHSRSEFTEDWSINASMLGQGGARWLPVRDVAQYSADLFRTIARSKSVLLPAPRIVRTPVRGEEVARFERRELKLVCRGMLHFSTNVTAEVIGLSAGHRTASPSSLEASAALAVDWVRETYGVGRLTLFDHSGLNPNNAITAGSMARIVQKAAKDGKLDGLLRRYFVSGSSGRGEAVPGASVRAKTGSLNFVRGLSGVITGRNDRRLAFAIFSNDLEARSKADHSLETPPGAKRFANRARVFEQAVLRRWLLAYGR
jgi:D-alanyl-D-alanine carboxypeptidase/D-alanyl-D-alanine-endopeptidase (penicillin-binding protein 4)